ncbi:MAG: hypothetical protein WBF42_02225 [Terracidiphilus sp.]
MRRLVGNVALVLFVGMTPIFALGQSQGADQGLPMGAPPTPDTSRIQQEMQQQQPQLPQGGKGSERESQMAAHVLPPAGPLKVSFGDKSAVWTGEKLLALPQTTITVYNEHQKKKQTFSGVPVIDLLTPLGVAAKPHGKDFQLYLVAEGSDGYKVVYSIGEVTPDVHDGTVLVADKLAGRPIAGTGPVQLVATGEKRPARWVRNIVAIRVLPAQ